MGSVEKVRLGRTNLVVTRLGFGGIPIQRLDEEEAVSVVRAVIEMGVDLLDTSRAYTNSERRIGLALRQADRPVILSSKSLTRTNQIYGDVLESLRQLGVKKIQMYHLHNVSSAEDYDKVMAPGGAYEGLKRAQAEGLIDHIGMTGHNLALLEKVIRDGQVDVIMACYSFLEPAAAEKVFPLAMARDVGILTMKAFSGGVIEEAGPALRFVFSQPGIAPVLGCEVLEKAQENWRIFKEGRSLTEEDQERIQAIRKEMERQFCRRCDYCQPCAEGVNIQFAVGLKAILKRNGSRAAYESDWLKEVIEKARRCSECGTCLSRCPYQLPIPDLIKENLAFFDALGEKETGRC